MTFLIGLIPILLFCRVAGRVVKAVGVAPGPWYVLTVVLWVAGSFIFAIIGTVAFVPLAEIERGDSRPPPEVVVTSFIGAIVGGSVAIKLARRRARRRVEEMQIEHLSREGLAAPAPQTPS